MSTTASGRRQRSDGIRSRTTILRTAARLASTRGLDRLSIGDLAEEAGMSKSGLYAHFGSKEELQLATIETAKEIYDAEVLEPAGRAEPGLRRLLALAEAFIGHLERRVFPGGCFFNAAASAIADRQGRVHDRLAAFQAGWLALLTEQATIARETGQIAPDEDVEQLVFELESYLLNAHAGFAFNGDVRVLERARRAIRGRLRSD
jgi:AcrR family transcriptional regulator